MDPGASLPRPRNTLGVPAAVALPARCTLSLDADATWLDELTLAGGAPMRLIRLAPGARALVDRWIAGDVLSERADERQVARRLVTAGLLHPRFDASGRDPSDVTVVIPVRDRSGSLEALMGSLGELEVIVVDDGSADRAGIAAIADRFGARLIRHDVARGPAAARNSGLAQVSTPLCCFIDSDCIVGEGWLEPLQAALTDPMVALAAPRLRGPRGGGAVQRFEHEQSPLDLGPSPAVVRPGSRVSYVPSATMLVRRALGDELFDERLATGEDVDLVWRLAEAGWSIRYEPDALVEHPARRGLRPWIDQRRSYGASAIALEERHGDAAAPISGSGWTLGAWALGALGHPAAGAGLLGIAVEILRRRLIGVLDEPGRSAARLAALGSLRAGPSLARQVVRSYAPALALGSLASRRVRRATLLAVLAGEGARWRRSDRTLDPARFVAIAAADDMAYAIGLWGRAIRARRFGALKPRIVWRSRAFSPEALRAQRSAH